MKKPDKQETADNQEPTTDSSAAHLDYRPPNSRLTTMHSEVISGRGRIWKSVKGKNTAKFPGDRVEY